MSRLNDSLNDLLNSCEDTSLNTKLYLSEIKCINPTDIKPIHNLDIQKISEFKGLVFESICMEPLVNSAHLENKTIFLGYVHLYEIKINTEIYNYFKDKTNITFMCWMSSDDFIYICPNMTGFLCNVKINYNKEFATIHIPMKNYPHRIEKPIQE